MARGREKILIVHGGGQKISDYCEKLQLPVRKINGIRVTDAATLEVTQMVLLGLVQPQILQQLANHNISAIGLNAATHRLVSGTALDREALGAVGKITEIHTALFDAFLADYVGVIAPLALDEQDGWLNINGDNAAAELAVLLQAEALYLLTDVAGVLENGAVIDQLDAAQAELLQLNGVITAGMQPKINAGFFALEQGVETVLIGQQLGAGGTQLI